ncbi:holo-ACP synthase [candidate division TA06 bacterium]|uniref:Holo-[acyl-carrier-protein] synthase n=1 Tax=candidate division TA06 bacterium TaxID=2250710 RepID=A0A933I7H1_UNCT6|nr:holo-ACP synthase [candidate division TA06 bacterium]
MIIAIGTDIAKVERVEKAYQRYGQRFLEKIFTGGEIRFCLSRKHPAPALAARFAAKEAVSKCLGTGFHRGVYPNLIEIMDNEKSRPTVKLHGRALEFGKDNVFHLSLSHEKEYVIAVAVMEKV